MKKYIIPILKNLGFIVIFLLGFITIIHLMNDKNWLVIPVTILSILLDGIYFKITEVKRCPKCNSKSKFTRVSGSKYKQWYCKKCKDTFWTTLFTEEYE